MRVRTSFAFVAATILIAVLFAGAVTVPAAAQYDTMQFRYDATHSGDYNAVAGPTMSNQLKWSNTTGGLGYSSPAVVNGVVYVENYGGYVYAFNATTGAQLWTNTTGGGSNVESSPAVANGIVYVANNGHYSVSTGNYGEVLFAFNATTGVRLWENTSGDTYFSSPAVANGVVYIGSYGDVYAFNSTNGTQLWMSPTTTTGEVESSPAVVNNVVYVGDTNGDVWAFNANNGTQLWMNTTGDFIRSSAAVANGVVYIGSYNDEVYAFNANTGTLLWNYTTGSQVESSPAVAKGVVYVGSDDNNLYALNATSGAKLWSFTNGYRVFSSPAVVNGIVYVGDNSEYLYAIGNGLLTTLTATASTTTANVTQNFTINGTLSAGSAAIPGATITLQNSTNNATWTNVTTRTTNASGGYSFSKNETALGTYYYRSAYNGNATYASATSNVVKVTVQETTLSIAASNTTPKANQTFNFTGILALYNGASSTPLTGLKVYLEDSSSSSGPWSLASSSAATTNAAGKYGFVGRINKAGTYYVRAYFDGTTAYPGCASPTVKVVVSPTGNVVTVTVQHIPTTLSIAASNTTVKVNQAFDFTAVG